MTQQEHRKILDEMVDKIRAYVGGEHIDINRLSMFAHMNQSFLNKQYEAEAMLELLEKQLKSEFNLTPNELSSFFLHFNGASRAGGETK